MDIYKVTLEFIESKCSLDYEHILFGIQQHWITNEEVVKFAERRVTHGVVSDVDYEIASLLKDDVGMVSSIITENYENLDLSKDELKTFWLRAIVLYIYEHFGKYEDPFELLANLYADFNYPEEIKNLVYYNVPSDESQGGKEYLMNQLERYVNNISC
ncbi:MAG: DUF2247 family protein [Cyclobacteriaceae bacterium]